MPILIFAFALMIGSSLAITTISHSAPSYIAETPAEPELSMGANLSADTDTSLPSAPGHASLTSYGSAVLNAGL